MRKLRAAVCLMLLVLLIPVVIRLRSRLPMDVQPLIEKKYGGWAGTLRLWVCEGWTPGAGTAAGWLNRCATSFEKTHPGVYIQPEYVSRSALSGLGTDGILPPDMLLFPPGTSNGGRFLPLDAPEDLRAPLSRTGYIGEACYAVPVMLGGYLWAYNTDLLDGIPGSWRGSGVMPLVPEDAPDHLWSAALLGLCSGLYVPEAEPAPSGELELGLPAGDPLPETTAAEAGAPCLLPEDFAASDDAWRTFVNGDGAAMLATQREIARLKALDEQGAGPEWRLSAGAGLYTDQALYLGIVDRDDPDRAALCAAFLRHLLSDACQGELWRAGAFGVTGAPSGYSAGDPMAALEAALRADTLAAAPAFDTAWRDDAKSIVREFLENNGDPADLWARLTARLRQNSEH